MKAKDLLSLILLFLFNFVLHFARLFVVKNR